jgi:sugar lactone lactonase YvrE
MRVPSALLVLCLACTGCPESRTTLLLHVQAAAGLTVTQLSVTIKLGTGEMVTQTLPKAGGKPKLPGDALVLLPDVKTSVEASLSAMDDAGNMIIADGSTQSNPHHEAQMTLTLGGGSGDGGSDGGMGGDGSMQGDGAVVHDLALPDIPPLVPTTLDVIAGKAGGAGEADGTGNAARTNGPQAILNVAGTVYFTDGSGVLRYFDPTTLAVTSIPLVDPGGSPFFLAYNAQGLAYDANTNLFYVASTNESVIRKISVVGGVGHESLVAGMSYTDGAQDAVGNAAGFKDPQGLALDGNGNLWVADTGNGTVRVVQLATNQVLTAAGTPNMTGWVDATGAAAKFKRPNDIELFNGNLYVSDGQSGASGNSGIRQLTLTASPSPSPAAVTTVVDTLLMPSTMDGTVANAGFGNAFGMANDGSSLWVVDSNRNNVRQVILGNNVTTILGDPAAGGGGTDANGQMARFEDPRYIALTATSGWITDDYESVIRRFDLTTPFAVTTPIGAPANFGTQNGIGAAARFNQPAALATGGPDFVYVTEMANQTVRKLTISTGNVELVACGQNLPASTDGPSNNCSFGSPSAIAVDNSGNLYVLDSNTSVLRYVAFSGGGATVSTVAGQKNVTGSMDAVGTAATFDGPSGLAFDGDHTLYIADYEQDLIRTYDTNTKMVTTIAGVAGTYGAKNGAGLTAHFGNPIGLAYDRIGGKLYVSEDNNDIRVITFNPVMVARLSGMPGTSGHADGAFANATFQRPGAMAVDATGRTLWVADYDAGTVRELDLVGQMVSTPIGVPHHQATLPGPLPASLNTPGGLALVPAGLVITSVNENVVLLAH